MTLDPIRSPAAAPPRVRGPATRVTLVLLGSALLLSCSALLPPGAVVSAAGWALDLRPPLLVGGVPRKQAQGSGALLEKNTWMQCSTCRKDGY